MSISVNPLFGCPESLLVSGARIISHHLAMAKGEFDHEHLSHTH
jgi:hypothetical protein